MARMSQLGSWLYLFPVHPLLPFRPVLELPQFSRTFPLRNHLARMARSFLSCKPASSNKLPNQTSELA
jgi:hypothetical protein